MFNKSINIQLKTDAISINLDKESSQKEIVDELKKKLPELKKLYKDDKTPIRITGKVLKNREIAEILEIIKGQIDVRVDFDMPKELGLSNITRVYEQNIKVSETKFHRGSLRSGQRIESEGSIVVLGDVNSGAEVIASDNIVVLGHLRGLAHAGAKGNKQAIISAGMLDTVQLRIANVIKKFEKDECLIHRYAYVFVNGDDIVIE